jgi:hypothetical protein
MHAVNSFIFFATVWIALVIAAPTARQCRHPPAAANDGVGDVVSAAPKTTSSSAAQSTSPASDNSLSSLFPSGVGSESWSTSPDSPHSLPLSDSTLNPTSVMQSLGHSYVAAPDGKMAMQAVYDKGSYALVPTPPGGISFYALGPANVDLSTAKEATFGYSVFFEEGFDFNLGGKLPGICMLSPYPYRSPQLSSHLCVNTDGGNSAEEAIGCSGGRRDIGCFSARLMWRRDGAGEMYTYLPPGLEGNNDVCNIKPFSTCNPTYGASIARGSYKWTPGQWNTVSERVKLNDVGQANGELELFVGGQSVIHVSGVTLRDSPAGRMRGIQMQTFFGGM